MELLGFIAVLALCWVSGWVIAALFILIMRLGIWLCFYVSTLFISKNTRNKYRVKWQELWNG